MKKEFDISISLYFGIAASHSQRRKKLDTKTSVLKGDDRIVFLYMHASTYLLISRILCNSENCLITLFMLVSTFFSLIALIFTKYMKKFH